MKKNFEYHDYIIHDVFSGISGIMSRKMFSGWGVYKDGIFFALISDGELYFKVDETSRAKYEALGSHPFTYIKQGKTQTLSYWLVPEEILEDREKIVEWVDDAVHVKLQKKR